jgi:hypothetical protein
VCRRVLAGEAGVVWVQREAIWTRTADWRQIGVLGETGGWPQGQERRRSHAQPAAASVAKNSIPLLRQ